MTNNGGFIGDDFYSEFENDTSSAFSTHLQNMEGGLYAPPVDLGIPSGSNTGDLLAPVDPGNTLEDALYLGQSSGNDSTGYIDRIGGSDELDIFAFEVSRGDLFNFFLDGLSADADLDLVNARGEIIASSENSQNNSEILVAELPPGDYYLGIHSFNGEVTSYDLDIFGGLSAQPADLLVQLGFNPRLITSV